MKIQPQDLRIGNIVTVNNPKYHPQLKDIPLLITGIHENSNGYVVNLEHINKTPHTYYESYCQPIECIQPIPLTEELLLKCQLEGSESDTAIYFAAKAFKGILISISKEDNSVSVTYNGNVLICDYLHQLQNATKIITGTEIKIKL